MDIVEREVLKIEKEEIKDISFSKKEVLSDINDQQQRAHDLERAQTLGNASQGKVVITFESSDNKIYRVETTIWFVGSQFVTLKGGITIPIHSILKVV